MKHELLAERIVTSLSAGPRDKVELRNELVGRNLTYQAFYKALGQLKKEEIVTVHRATVSLSVIWLEKERKRIERAADAYNLSGYQSYFGGIKKGAKRTFHFKTLADLELFWTHAVLVAVGAAHRDAVILSFLPHDWFNLLRPENADMWYELLGKRNAHVNVLTHATAEEKRHSVHPQAETIENMFGVNPLKQKESVYINVIDDLIFEATLDENVVPGIRRAVRGAAEDTQTLIRRKGAFRFSVRRDADKAKAFKKKVQKYFSLAL